MSIRDTIVLSKGFTTGKHLKGGTTINNKLRNIGRNIMTLKTSRDINPLNWTLNEIVAEVREKRISTDQGLKMLERKKQILDEKFNKCRNTVKSTNSS